MMRSTGQLLAGGVFLVLAAIGLRGAPAHAADVLLNGGLEQGGGGPASWNTTTSITGNPTAVVGAYELRDQGNNPMPPPVTGLGIAIDTWAGNDGAYANQNKMVNFVMTQTTAAAAGATFTFSGDAFIQQSASSFLTTLSPLPAGPGDYNQDGAIDAADYTVWRASLGSTTNLVADGDGSGTIDQADYDLWKTNFGRAGQGAIPSPTSTFFKVEFLNGSSASATVLGSQTLDLRTDTPTPDTYQTHTFTTAASPAGTTNARVTVAALNMVQGCDSASNCTGGHDLDFDNFSLIQNGAFGGQKLTNGNLDKAGAPANFTVTNSVTDNFQFSTDANSNYDIAQGKGVAGETGLWLRAFQGGDVTITQTVPGVVGDQYTFSAWSKWEANFRGGDPLSGTQDFFKIEFLNSSNGVISSQTLDLRTVQMLDETWRQLSMAAATAPAGTTSVRVSEITTGMIAETGPKLSAFYDDFSLIQTAPGSAAAVPEPSSFALLGVGLGMIGVWRRRHAKKSRPGNSPRIESL